MIHTRSVSRDRYTSIRYYYIVGILYYGYRISISVFFSFLNINCFVRRTVKKCIQYPVIINLARFFFRLFHSHAPSAKSLMRAWWETRKPIIIKLLYTHFRYLYARARCVLFHVWWVFHYIIITITRTLCTDRYSMYLI